MDIFAALEKNGQTAWKFGIVTREIVKVNDNQFEIHDTSDGWNFATVTRKELEEIVNGSIQLHELNWK